jgi:hypothetical protein
MMRGVRRLIVYTAVAGFLTAGAISASMEFAHADTPITSCDGTQGGTGNTYKCTVSGTGISDPAAITVTVSDDTTGYTEAVVINYTVQCDDTANGQTQTAGAPSEETPITLNLQLPESADGTCSVTALVSAPTPVTGSTTSANCPAVTASSTPGPSPSPTASVCPDDFTAALSYTATASASPTASSTSSGSGTSSSVHPVKGYDGKCLDDNGNSSSNGSKIQIWGCSGSDQAENWTYSNSEFVHNGRCMNDKGNGGSGSKVILYKCNGGSNEKWSELANGELKLKSHNGSLCADDPRSSTKNGTQLIVYTCHDSANQKWSLP